jgi:hypothetical protein
MANNQRRTPGQRRAKPAQRNNAPEVVYKPGRDFNRNRLILNLITVAAVAFAVFLGLSIFFKVDEVRVVGTDRYSEWTVYEASGIQEGDNLLFFGQANASSKIISALPYVTSVRYDIDLPGTLNIIIEEAPVAYCVQSEDGTWWLMTSQGRLAEQVTAAVAADHPRIDGVTLRDPLVGSQAVAAESGQGAVTGADRLSVALQIMSQLEAKELFDRVASVDVSSLQHLEFWCGQQYQVKLGDAQRLDYKIAAVRSAIEKSSSYQTGILDASFTIFPQSVGYMAFPD